MNLFFSDVAREQIRNTEEYIAKDNPQTARKYIQKLLLKIEEISQFPYLGKVNPVYSRNDIREYVIMGFKVIYQVKEKDIYILAVYKVINFDETSLKNNLK